MSLLSGRQEFLRSEKAVLLRQELEAMVESPMYNTATRYSVAAAGTQFVDNHMKYMARYLNMDHSQYILNVKLMTKVHT